MLQTAENVVEEVRVTAILILTPFWQLSVIPKQGPFLIMSSSIGNYNDFTPWFGKTRYWSCKIEESRPQKCDLVVLHFFLLEAIKPRSDVTMTCQERYCDYIVLYVWHHVVMWNLTTQDWQSNFAGGEDTNSWMCHMFHGIYPETQTSMLWTVWACTCVHSMCHPWVQEEKVLSLLRQSNWQTEDNSTQVVLLNITHLATCLELTVLGRRQAVDITCKLQKRHWCSVSFLSLKLTVKIDVQCDIGTTWWDFHVLFLLNIGLITAHKFKVKFDDDVCTESLKRS